MKALALDGESGMLRMMRKQLQKARDRLKEAENKLPEAMKHAHETPVVKICSFKSSFTQQIQTEF